MWQTGPLLWPCMGAVQLLCPGSGGGNATVKLSPKCTTVELNNNHLTLGTHNGQAGPFVAFCRFTYIRQRYIFQRHISSCFFVRLGPTSCAHAFHFFLRVTSSSFSLSRSLSFCLSLSLSAPPFPRQLQVPRGSLASQLSSPLIPIFPPNC